MYTDFITAAKSKGRPVILMAFSSMPVSRTDILTTASIMIEQCQSKPAVVAMIGDRPVEKVGDSLEERAAKHKGDGLLLEVASPPPPSSPTALPVSAPPPNNHRTAAQATGAFLSELLSCHFFMNCGM